MYLRYSASTILREDTGMYSSGSKTRKSLKTLLMFWRRMELMSKLRSSL